MTGPRATTVNMIRTIGGGSVVVYSLFVVALTVLITLGPFYGVVLGVLSSLVIILLRRRELVALL